MLRRIELEVLATVDRGDTISELATKLEHSESYLSRAVGDVDEADLREQAAKYGLEDEIDALLRYLEMYGEVDDDRLRSGTSSRSWRLTTR